MVSIGNLGEYNKTVYYFYKENRVICESFDNTLEEFIKAVENKYGDSCKEYNNVINLFKLYKEF